MPESRGFVPPSSILRPAVGSKGRGNNSEKISSRQSRNTAAVGNASIFASPNSTGDSTMERASHAGGEWPLLLELEQLSLHLLAAAEAADGAVGGNDPVTRNQNGNGIG